jgi:hypothetical protein
MTEKIRNKLRAIAGNTRLLILITIGVVVSAITTMIVNAVLLDGDGDNMSDAYEQLFGLNPADDSDAALNYDDDTLNNLAEFGLSTDPWSSDTDRDGWYDDVDNVPLSRIYIDWGNTAFTTDDDFIYTGPIWWLSAFRTGGLWQTNPPAWTVASTEADGVGSLCIEIDRGVQTNNLVMSLHLHDHAGAALGVDLLDTNGIVVAGNIYSNILTGTDADVELKLFIPLIANSSASVIRLFRTTGEITVYETLLYVDRDLDGLDEDQEAQLGTSDNAADSDNDGLSDYAEVFTHGTSPTTFDTDGDGISDYDEITIYGTSPVLKDTDGDGMRDGWEISHGFDPLVDNGTSVPESGIIAWFKTDVLSLSDGDAVASWLNSAGGGVLSQSSSVSRPVYRTNAYGIAAVEFVMGRTTRFPALSMLPEILRPLSQWFVSISFISPLEITTMQSDSEQPRPGVT